MSQSIVAAYNTKYADETAEESPEVEIVFVKRERFKLLNLVLDKCNITEVGPVDRLRDICQNITEYDLSHNNITSWTEVYKLLEISTQVTFLNLSCNHLSVPVSLPLRPFSSVSCLVLYGNDIRWEDLLEVLQFLPSVTDLNIGNNNISTLCRPSTPIPLPDLIELNLIKNKITTFLNILDLAVMFPNLATLVLSDNPLSSFGDDNQISDRFVKITKLHLNNITVDSWDEVSKLRWFPKLNDIRMVHWSMFGEMSEDERRSMLAALLPHCGLINGTPILEREAAERWYLRRCDASRETAGVRYTELHEKYGELPNLADVQLGGHETISLVISVPERGVQIHRTFSIYDTFLAVKTQIEGVLNVQLSPNHIKLIKSPQAISDEGDCTPQAIPPINIPVVTAKSMLFLALKQRGSAVTLESGDTLQFQLAGSRPDFLKKGEGKLARLHHQNSLL